MLVRVVIRILQKNTGTALLCSVHDSFIRFAWIYNFYIPQGGTPDGLHDPSFNQTKPKNLRSLPTGTKPIDLGKRQLAMLAHINPR